MSSRQSGRGLAVVTSTSIGIGVATALYLADKRFGVVASVRGDADGAASADSPTPGDPIRPT